MTERSLNQKALLSLAQDAIGYCVRGEDAPSSLKAEIEGLNALDKARFEWYVMGHRDGVRDVRAVAFRKTKEPSADVCGGGPEVETNAPESLAPAAYYDEAETYRRSANLIVFGAIVAAFLIGLAIWTTIRTGELHQEMQQTSAEWGQR